MPGSGLSVHPQPFRAGVGGPDRRNSFESESWDDNNGVVWFTRDNGGTFGAAVSNLDLTMEVYCRVPSRLEISGMADISNFVDGIYNQINGLFIVDGVTVPPSNQPAVGHDHDNAILVLSAVEIVDVAAGKHSITWRQSHVTGTSATVGTPYRSLRVRAGRQPPPV